MRLNYEWNEGEKGFHKNDGSRDWQAKDLKNGFLDFLTIKDVINIHNVLIIF